MAFEFFFFEFDWFFFVADCKHPKTVEDFLISTPNSKVSFFFFESRVSGFCSVWLLRKSGKRIWNHVCLFRCWLTQLTRLLLVTPYGFRISCSVASYLFLFAEKVREKKKKITDFVFCGFFPVLI